MTAMSLLARLDRFDQRHPWSHNELYAPWVVRRVAATGARRVLDVGCGTGNLIDLARPHVARSPAWSPPPIP